MFWEVKGKTKILTGLVSLFLGILSGFIFLWSLPKLPLSVDNPLYKFFGINLSKVVGFQPYWLLERADKKYDPYITTLSYFSLVIDSDGTIQKLVNPNEEEPGWTTLKSGILNQKLKEARRQNLNLSLLLHNSNESSISALLKNPTQNARNLISDVAPIMQKFEFSDLNLDIESFQEASPSSRQKFTRFIQEVKKGLKENKLGTLTLEISPSVLVKRLLIDPEEIGKIGDYIILMAYDYHYAGSYVSGPVAPLNGAGKAREYDVKTALKEALRVIPNKKLILGIPLYGYEWETLNKITGAPAIPGGGATASHRRVTKLLSECKNCSKSIDKLSQESYVIFPDQKEDYYHQIFYEEKEALGKKLDLAKNSKIGGVALWALGYEGEKILEPLKFYKRRVL